MRWIELVKLLHRDVTRSSDLALVAAKDYCHVKRQSHSTEHSRPPINYEVS